MIFCHPKKHQKTVPDLETTKLTDYLGHSPWQIWTDLPVPAYPIISRRLWNVVRARVCFHAAKCWKRLFIAEATLSSMEPETGWLEDYNSVLLGWPRFSGRVPHCKVHFFVGVCCCSFPCGARISTLLPCDSEGDMSGDVSRDGARHRCLFFRRKHATWSMEWNLVPFTGGSPISTNNTVDGKSLHQLIW